MMKRRHCNEVATGVVLTGLALAPTIDQALSLSDLRHEGDHVHSAPAVPALPESEQIQRVGGALSAVEPVGSNSTGGTTRTIDHGVPFGFGTGWVTHSASS